MQRLNNSPIAFLWCFSPAVGKGDGFPVLPTPDIWVLPCSSLSLTPHNWSPDPVCSPCQIYIRPLPHLKHEESNLTTPSPSQQPPLSLSISQTSTWNESLTPPAHLPHPLQLASVASCPQFPLSVLTTFQQWVSDQTRKWTLHSASYLSNLDTWPLLFSLTALLEYILHVKIHHFKQMINFSNDWVVSHRHKSVTRTSSAQ